MGEVFKLNHCYNMDCLPAMELFPDNYFDLAVVDPPYFSGPERRGFYGSKVSKIGVHRDYPVSPAWSKPEPEYFRELFRVCRHYIVWGCNYFDYQFATGRIVWDKCNGNSSFSDCEIAATNLFSSVRMFRYMWSGMMQGKSITEGDTMQGNKSLNEKRIHPTQKPVALYDWIFKNYAEPGQKILDTHLGSGSSRIAAYDLYIGTKTAIFPLTGFPKAQNESELATLLGISKKEWADIEFDNDCPDDLHHIEGMDLDDTADGEMDCVTGRIGIRYCGCELVPMIEPVSGTVGFVDAKQIMPVADEIRKSGYFKYCARKMASGGRYYVIKDGMVVRGAVLPVKLEPLAKSGLRELADMVKKTRDVADVEDLSEQEDKNDA